MLSSMSTSTRSRVLLTLTALLVLAVLALPAGAAQRRERYRNPLLPAIPGDGVVESCADPSVIYAPGSAYPSPGQARGYWYMYCTSDPLNDEDRNAAGDFNFRLIPTMRSENLVDWVYLGDAFTGRPPYAEPDAGIWAPEIEYVAAENLYYLYYVVTDTTLPGGGSAIGVATSSGPAGPWTHQATPVVEPHPADCCPDSRRWVFDPEVLQTPSGTFMYYGSYFGGISVRLLERTTAGDVVTRRETQRNVAVANKYEGAEVVFRDGYYYLFVSATDCCRGPLTGYSVFVGRSQSPTGPFEDRSGVDLNDDEMPEDATDALVGGSVAITFNGNRWVGVGHNTVFEDFDGRWWTIYHAIDRNEPYFEGGVDIFDGGDLNKRPALLDPLDWVDGWPVLNGGAGPSDTPQRAPAAQPGQKSDDRSPIVREPRLGRRIQNASDEFDRNRLDRGWSWVREPAAGSYTVADDVLRWPTQAADLFEGSNSASVLTRPAPNGDYVVETRVRLEVPDEGCCFNFAQAGLVIYGDDDNFVKLATASIFNTRQTEWAKELAPVPAGYPRYGNSVVGPPGEWTLLRIVKTRQGQEERYTAYTKREGSNVWERGATWTHRLGRNARIGLVSMGVQAPPPPETPPSFPALFDYVRVYELNAR